MPRRSCCVFIALALIVFGLLLWQLSGLVLLIFGAVVVALLRAIVGQAIRFTCITAEAAPAGAARRCCNAASPGFAPGVMGSSDCVHPQ
jgi:hypothetical protein